MWTWIAKFFGHMPDPPERCPNTLEATDTPAPESVSSGIPGDSPTSDAPESAAEPVSNAPDQVEAKPVRFPYPVPIPSRNGTHASH